MEAPGLEVEAGRSAAVPASAAAEAVAFGITRAGLQAVVAVAAASARIAPAPQERVEPQNAIFTGLLLM